MEVRWKWKCLIIRVAVDGLYGPTVATSSKILSTVLVLASLVPSLHSQLFSHRVEKRERACKIYFRECIIFAGSVRGFVECSDLAAPT